MTPYIIGLDLSLAGTGIATALGHNVRGTSAALPIEDRLIMLRDFVMGAAQAASHFGDLLVIVEDPVTRTPAAVQLGMLQGVVRVALHEAGVPFVGVLPATLKKYITGKGNAPKSDMRMATFKRFHVDIDDDNACDAFGLRAMALDAYGSPLAPMPADQRAALEKVDWPRFGEVAA